MAARDREFDDMDRLVAKARLYESVLPVSNAELTDDHFIRGVALALRAQWEGEDHFQAVADGRIYDRQALAEWSEYRGESVAAILAFLQLLDERGFRIVRKAN